MIENLTEKFGSCPKKIDFIKKSFKVHKVYGVIAKLPPEYDKHAKFEFFIDLYDKTYLKTSTCPNDRETTQTSNIRSSTIKPGQSQTNAPEVTSNESDRVNVNNSSNANEKKDEYTTNETTTLKVNQENTRINENQRIDAAYTKLAKNLKFWYADKSADFLDSYEKLLKSKSIERDDFFFEMVLKENLFKTQNQGNYEEFQKDYSERLKIALRKQTLLILNQRQDEDEIYQILEYIMKTNLVATKEQIDDRSWLQARIDPIINSYRDEQQANELKNLQDKLSQWYGGLVTLNENLVGFLRTANVAANSLKQMSKSQYDFLNAIKTYKQFSSDHQSELREAALTRIKNVLIKRDPKSPEILERLKPTMQQTELTLSTVYDSVQLGNTFNATIDGIRHQLRHDDAFDGLQKKMNDWFKGSESFVGAFMNFVKPQPTETLQWLSDRRIFLNPENSFLNNFYSKNRNLTNDEIYRKAHKILQNQSSRKADLNLVKLKSANIEESFTVDMLHNAEELKLFVLTELARILLNECEANVKEGVKNRIQHEKTDQDVFEAHFEGNVCVVLEICKRKLSFDQNHLDSELEPYFTAFRKFHNGEEFTNNKNIRDEIDQTIYEVIRNHLVNKKKYSETCAGCAVNYMRRKNSIDEKYTPDHLFDEDKLEDILKTPLQDYESFNKEIQGGTNSLMSPSHAHPRPSYPYVSAHVGPRI